MFILKIIIFLCKILKCTRIMSILYYLFIIYYVLLIGIYNFGNVKNFQKLNWENLALVPKKVHHPYSLVYRSRLFVTAKMHDIMVLYYNTHLYRETVRLRLYLYIDRDSRSEFCRTAAQLRHNIIRASLALKMKENGANGNIET